MDPLNVLAKFEVRISFPVPEIGGTRKKIGQSVDTPMLPFLPIFLELNECLLFVVFIVIT